MAKFNTLAGGYYGKLGATVGQRWKNLRTVRTYVIPANPQTPTQQANRRRFSDCVWYAQIAQQINPKTTAFDTTAKTLWNCRMSTARALQDLSLTEMDRIPLYPTTFSLPYTISAATVSGIVDTNHVEVTVEGVTLNEERVLVMLVLLPGVESWKDRLVLCIGSNGDTGGNVFTFRIPEGVTFTDGMKARFCSCDDVSSGTDLIASSQINLPMATIDVHTFDTSLRNVNRESNYFKITFNEPFNNGTNEISGVSLHCVVKGGFTDLSVSSPTLINDGGYFATTVPFSAAYGEEIPALPSGSYLSIDSVSSVSATVQATATNTQTNTVDESDLLRTVTSLPTKGTEGNSVTFGWTFNGTFTTKQESVGCTGKDNFHLGLQDFSMTGRWACYDSTCYYARASTANRPAFSGSKITANASFDGVANGVTYRFSLTDFAFTNVGTGEITSTLHEDAATIMMNLSSISTILKIDGIDQAVSSGSQITFRSAKEITLDGGDVGASIEPTALYDVSIYSTDGFEFTLTGSVSASTDEYFEGSLSAPADWLEVGTPDGSKFYFSAFNDWNGEFDPS